MRLLCRHRASPWWMSNRKIAWSDKQKQCGPSQAVSTRALPAGTILSVWLEGVDFPRLLTMFTNEDGAAGTLYPVTSALTLPYDRLTNL